MHFNVRVMLLILNLFISCLFSANSFPHSNGSREIVVVEEIVTCCMEAVKDSSATLITPDEQNNESAIESMDDLIFLAKKTTTAATIASMPQQQSHYTANTEIDLLTSADEDTLTSASTSSSEELVVVVEEEKHKQHDAKQRNCAQEHDGSGIPREIELRNDNSAQTGAGATAVTAAPFIDMSDFVALIPAAEVKSIAANYYRNDVEVQRAYAYLNSADFVALKQRIIDLPEMSAFLRYLNSSGLNLVGFLHNLTNLTAGKLATDSLIGGQRVGNSIIIGSGAASANDIEQYSTDSIKPAVATAASFVVTPTPSLETTTKEQLNGLHGLVDSILDVLPQDEILATFFDKLETNEQFAKLVDNISNPVFAKILGSMENSVPLRNLIFTLHNNGIYITRIVDSLKAYFFLGTF